MSTLPVRNFLAPLAPLAPLALPTLASGLVPVVRFVPFLAPSRSYFPPFSLVSLHALSFHSAGFSPPFLVGGFARPPKTVATPLLIVRPAVVARSFAYSRLAPLAPFRSLYGGYGLKNALPPPCPPLPMRGVARPRSHCCVFTRIRSGYRPALFFFSNLPAPALAQSKKKNKAFSTVMSLGIPCDLIA